MKQQPSSMKSSEHLVVLHQNLIWAITTSAAHVHYIQLKKKKEPVYPSKSHQNRNQSFTISYHTEYTTITLEEKDGLITARKTHKERYR